MIRRRKGMKLDQALKLYIALYCICFMLTWLISVPMLIHVTPQSECLLFVTPYVKYGNPATCNIVGIIPLFVAVASVVLIVLHVMQLRSLKAFLRKPGPHSSNLHHRPTHIFWRLVVFHIIVTLVVLTITAISTAGYYQTCVNLHQEVRNTVRSRVAPEKWGTGKNTRNNEIIDTFSDDRSINRYVNPNSDPWGNSAYEYGITCRNILTDPEIHSQLKMNHAANPYYKQYYGFWYKHDVSDVGDIRYYTYRNNMILEMSMAGCWISFVLWTTMLILMVKERHHIKAHLTDESMWGSEFGGSRRSASRMSNQSFDKMSRVSQSTATRGSRGGSRPPQQFDQMSYQGSIPGSTRSGGGGGRRAANGQGRQPPQHQQHQPIQKPIVQNSLLDYFSTNPKPDFGEVDIDAALQDDQIMNGFGDHGVPETGPLDTSFGSGGLPDNLLNATEDYNGPIALGDEVSQAYSSNNNVSTFEPQFENGQFFPGDESHVFSSNPVPVNPNRQQGRRGGGRSSSSGPPGRPHHPNDRQRSPSHSLTRPYNAQQYQIDHRSVSQAESRQPYHQPYVSKSPQSSFRKSAPRSPGGSEIPQGRMNVSFNSGTRGQAPPAPPPPPQSSQQRSYKTSLGHQSMI